MSNYETFTYKVPTRIAVALINGDVSGITADESDELDIFTRIVLKDHGHTNFSYGAGNNNESFSATNDVNNLGANCINLDLLVKLPYSKIEVIIANELKTETIAHHCYDNIRDSFDSDIMSDKEMNKIYSESVENTWLWCDVEVKAIWENIEISEYIGGCSYKSEKDFIKNSPYYGDMLKTAKDRMKAKLEILKEKLS